jgi:thrombospondin type 3 repeat protein
MPNHPRTARSPRFIATAVAVVVVFVGLQSLAGAWPSLGEHTVVKRTAVASRDTDRDGLTNWTEINKTKTNPRRADTDGDGLSDWTEVNKTKTNPRRADTDGDGAKDGAEVAAGSDPRNAASVPTPSTPPPPSPPPSSEPPPPPPPPPADTTPPNTSIVSAPATTTQSTSASFGFTSSEQGSKFACRLDTGAWLSCTSPKAYTVTIGNHSFSVRATDGAGNTDATPAAYSWTVEEPPPPGGETLAVWSSPSSAVVNTPVTLDGTSSKGSGSLDCTWSFENQDGSVVYQTQSGCKIDFTFESVGTKYVELIVEDSAGAADENKQSFPVSSTPPGPDTTPPNTSIGSNPGSTTIATSASFSFSSSESGSTFTCQLDGSAWAACTSPGSYSGLSLGSHAFAVRATDEAGNTDASPATWSWTIVEEEEETPPQANSCVSGAVKVTSTSALTSAVSSGNDACVTAALGDVNFTNMGNRSGVVVSTEGGSMGHLEISGTTNLTIDSARFRSVTIRGGHGTVVEDSTIGGTPSNRVYDQLVFLPDTSNDVVIRNNDIGWTNADNSGNTGYGCRCYGTLNRLQFVGNKVHDIAADGFQGVGGNDVLIDRNEFGPVGANSDSDEHSDNIQITYNDSNLRITNNWIHHQGYYEGGVTDSAGSTYIHGGSTGSLVYENNLVQSNRGRTEICGLGTGGTSRSNIIIRRNTWVDGGQAFTGFPGFEWDCDSGSGNLVERNIAVDPDGGFAQNGSAAAAVFASNLWGQSTLVTLDSAGNCTSANCNPAGQEPIGYRKPSGVDW